jgi:nitroreductase
MTPTMDPSNAVRMRWLIAHRHSSRTPFDPALPVTEVELAGIVDAARWAPTAHNMQNFRLVVVDDRRVLDELGRIRATVSPTFIIENYRQLSWSPEELAERRVGLLGTSFPPAWHTDDPARVPTDASRSLGETIAGAPLVIVVVFDPTTRAPASEGDMLGLISLGCVLENMWLAAQASHLDVQVMSAFSGDSAEPAVKRVLCIPAPWRVAYALRVGHAIACSTGPRVRRDLPSFTYRNRFG